jgi:hypothetical protein
MIFTHDTEAALGFVAALADTSPGSSDSGDDELSTPGQLAALLDSWKYSGRRDGDERELAEVRDARARLREIWLRDRDEAADAVNELIDWHIHATESAAPLARRILVEAAMALVDVIRGDQMDRLRSCDADDCDGLYLDASKNASRRFCSTRCGNRMAVRAYRARTA